MNIPKQRKTIRQISSKGTNWKGRENRSWETFRKQQVEQDDLRDVVDYNIQEVTETCSNIIIVQRVYLEYFELILSIYTTLNFFIYYIRL